MRRFVKKFEEQDNPANWFDEALDEDGVDLEEWAFWQGYYEEEAV